MDTFIQVWHELQRGGRWLSAAREWMQSNVPRGDTLTWGSAVPVTISFHKLEELAQKVAVSAVAEERMQARGPGTPAHRFEFLMAELEKRFPHPNPFDSTRAPELYALEAIDKLIEEHTAMKGLNEGWQMWNGEGVHPVGDVRVAYRMLDGCQCEDWEAARAGDLDWTRTDKRLDWEIAAYKVVK